MEMRPGYKLSEVGLIPADWETRRLGDLGTVVRGGSPRPAGDSRYFNGSFIPWLTVASLTNIPESQLFVTGTLSHLTKDGAERSRTLQKGLLVIVNSGAKTLGVSKLLSIECCANDGIAALINQRGGDKRFLCHYLNSQTKRLRENVAAGNDQLNLNTGRIAQIPVPFPSEAEQRAIAAALGDVDALLEGLTRLVAKKRSLKQAAIQQLLVGQTRLPGFQDEWKVKRLGDHVTFLRHGVNSRAELTVDGPVKYLHYGDVHACTGVLLAPDSLPSLPSEKATTLDRLRDGDLIIADASEDLVGVSKSVEMCGLGKSAVVAGLHTIAARFDKNILADGFKAYLQFSPAFSSQLRRLAAGTKVYATNRAHIASVEMRLPGVDEQAAIVSVFNEMNAEIEAIEARRNKTRALKQAITQELLTGRTRLV